ncbi:MAG: hypothetical protein M1820_001702 [Bogoriella megaspora]|nr:MAG: hypothetical protein M1820_001702 [Bogoriella megaspora]
MDRIRKALRRTPSYEPLEGGSIGPDGERIEEESGGFSWAAYSVFSLIGIAMLWAWNMFLAAGPYFQYRFSDDAKILRSFQSAELSVSTVANLGSMLVLQKLQKNASYPKRIVASLIINIATFTALTMSTKLFMGSSAGGYFAFIIIAVFATSLATGLCQNGVFAYVQSFGREEYTQAIMTGQAVAGVLPCLAQIASVLSVPDTQADAKENAHQQSNAAFAYFLTAVGVSTLTLVAFFWLVAQQRSAAARKAARIENEEAEESIDVEERKTVPLSVLAWKLRYLASSVFITFALAMTFPVFTQRIVSVQPSSELPRILQPAAFIPLAFLVWNSGDLCGRLLTAVPRLSLTQWPKTLVLFSIARAGFVPLYLLCNIDDKGALVKSDFFYLAVVQFLFGLTNGFAGSTSMMGAGEWVEPSEREAAGGFMGLCLVAGLAFGSLASFFASGA